MGWRNILEQNALEKIEEHWPKAQQIFEERIGASALAAARSDDTMRPLFKLAWEAMPFPVRMVVKEDIFVEFCFSNRDRLLPSQEVPAETGAISAW